MRMILKLAFCGMLLGSFGSNAQSWAQQAPAARPAESSKAQDALSRAAEAGKFAFVVFYKEDTPALRAMAGVVKDGIAKREDKATLVSVQVTNPAERTLVERFDVARSPMPLTLAVAPNGAVTGIFSKEITDENLDAAIVTPTMTRCMKSLQEKRLVFVCLQTAEKPVVPAAVRAMQADPQFKDRVVVVSMQLRDPEEARFLKQMQIDPGTTFGVTTVLLAPPGVLIGKFDSTSTAVQIGAALHKAGQCCDDANCKHNHAAPQQATQPNTSRRK
jgi:hypothetical protein